MKPELTLSAAAQQISGLLISLEQSIEDARATVLSAASEAAQMAEPFIGKKEAAAFLCINQSTLERRMAMRDGPPRYRDGGRVTFRRSELLEWKRQWRVGGAAQSLGRSQTTPAPLAKPGRR